MGMCASHPYVVDQAGACVHVGMCATHPYVVEQGGGVADAGWNALLVGGQLLQLVQQVPQAFQLQGRQVHLHTQLTSWRR